MSGTPDDISDFTPDEIAVVKAHVTFIEWNDAAWAGVNEMLVDRVMARQPISLFELKRLRAAVSWTKLDRSRAKEHRRIGDQIIFDRFYLSLDGLMKRLEEEKRSRRRLRGQEAEMDTLAFQRRITILNVTATVCSALAAAASLVVACLQYLK